MNQVVIDNRKKIVAAVTSCFRALDSYHKAVEAFGAEKKRIASMPYIQVEQERLVNQAADKLRNAVHGHCEQIQRELGTIRTAAEEMQNLMDIGEDLQNALSVVKSLGKALPPEVRIKLVEQFKGQYQALTMLKAAYEAVEIPSEPYFKGMIFDAPRTVKELEDKAACLADKPGENTMVAFSFGNDLEKFAQSLGVELPTRYRDAVDTSAAMSRQLRAVMGLSTGD